MRVYRRKRKYSLFREKAAGRDSGMEVLRIVCIFLIILHHYSVYGYDEKFLMGEVFNPNRYVIDMLSLGGKIGVNCFMLISGYYMVKTKFTLEKYLKIEGQVLFYSIAGMILFIYVLSPHSRISFSIALKNIFPILFSRYWFVTIYIVTMILSPFINKFIVCLQREDLRKLIVLLIVIWSVIPTVTTGEPAYAEIAWFITLYIIAAYIRLYVDLAKIKGSLCIAVIFISLLFLVASVLIFDYIGDSYSLDVVLAHSTYFKKENSIPVVFIAVGLLLLFGKIKWHKGRLSENPKVIFESGGQSSILKKKTKQCGVEN